LIKMGCIVTVVRYGSEKVVGKMTSRIPKLFPERSKFCDSISVLKIFPSNCYTPSPFRAQISRSISKPHEDDHASLTRGIRKVDSEIECLSGSIFVTLTIAFLRIPFSERTVGIYSCLTLMTEVVCGSADLESIIVTLTTVVLRIPLMQRIPCLYSPTLRTGESLHCPPAIWLKANNRF
jgi:hypothetical protein